MEIKTYEKASNIEEKYLSSLVDGEIECWWSRPFDEYKICSNRECRALYSIEDIYENIKNYRNRLDDILSQNHKCEICDSETEFIYEKNNFLKQIKEYVKWEVSRVLLIDDFDNVEWFWVLSKDSLENIIYKIFDSRVWSWDKEKIIWLISNRIFWNDDSRNEKFICSHQIYISPFAREWNIAIDLLRTLFSLNKSFKWYPIIWETRFDSKFYPITQIMWYQDLTYDKYWTVLQVSNDYDLVLNLFNSIDSFSDKKVLKPIINYKKKSASILKENSNFLKRKFYN